MESLLRERKRIPLFCNSVLICKAPNFPLPDRRESLRVRRCSVPLSLPVGCPFLIFLCTLPPVAGCRQQKPTNVLLPLPLGASVVVVGWATFCSIFNYSYSTRHSPRTVALSYCRPGRLHWCQRKLGDRMFDSARERRTVNSTTLFRSELGRFLHCALSPLISVNISYCPTVPWKVFNYAEEEEPMKCG